MAILLFDDGLLSRSFRNFSVDRLDRQEFRLVWDIARRHVPIETARTTILMLEVEKRRHLNSRPILYYDLGVSRLSCASSLGVELSIRHGVWPTLGTSPASLGCLPGRRRAPASRNYTVRDSHFPS